jgi:hypothetical protein
MQRALLFLCSFARGYVNADADDSVRASFAVIGNETARLDPTHLASTNDTILDIILASALTERLAAELFHPFYVVGVHASQAFAASYLGSALRKAVDGRIAWRNLHDLRDDVIRVTADESCLARQRKLNVSFSEGQLGLLMVSYVDRHVDRAEHGTGAVEKWRWVGDEMSAGAVGTLDDPLHAADLTLFLRSRRHRALVVGHWRTVGPE